jgi:hypothetical protein
VKKFAALLLLLCVGAFVVGCADSTTTSAPAPQNTPAPDAHDHSAEGGAPTEGATTPDAGAAAPGDAGAATEPAKPDGEAAPPGAAGEEKKDN